MRTAKELFGRYSPRGVVIDTNILLLHVVGSFDPTKISEFKITRGYDAQDYNTLIVFLRKFKGIVTTQCILTEASNHLGKLSDPLRRQVFESYSRQIQLLHEPSSPSAVLAGEAVFPRFGLTDVSILHEARGKYLVLTDDLPLFGYLDKVGVDALNFNYLRMASWMAT